MKEKGFFRQFNKPEAVFHSLRAFLFVFGKNGGNR